MQGWLVDGTAPDGLVVDTDLRWLLVSNLSRLGRLDEAAIAAEEARDTSITGSEQAAGARAARPDPAAKAEAWRLAVEDDAITNTRQNAICLSFWLRGQDHLLWPYLDRYFRAAEDISAARGVWAQKGSLAAQERAAPPVPLAGGQAGAARPAGPLAGHGRALQLGPAGDRGAPGRPPPLAALPVGLMLPEPVEGPEPVEIEVVRPFDGAALLSFLGRRCIAGVEAYAVVDGVPHFTRTLRLPHGPGVIDVAWTGIRAAGPHLDRGR